MKYRILYVALTSLLLVCSSVAFAEIRVACVGDSITAGWKLKEADRYVTKLGGLLGSGYDVQNFGHSAYAMLEIADKSYWDSPMFQAAKDFEPNVVTIMLGTNDAHPNYWPQYKDFYVQDYAAMIAEFEALPTNPRVIVLGLPYLKPGSRYDGVVEINALLPVIAADAEVDFVEIWNTLLDSGLSEQQLMKDPIHPSEEAHTIIAETVYPVVALSGAVCGDGSCGAGESSCNCADDCGAPPSTEESCNDAMDEDCDGATDCSDTDCVASPECQSTCKQNAICEPGEDCDICPSDCEGKRTGKPTGRYCCGNGAVEGPEGDGRCDGNW